MVVEESGGERERERELVRVWLIQSAGAAFPQSMAGSMSLQSVAAVFPPRGLRATGSRVPCWTPSLSRSSRHTGVRILWGGILSVQCCGYGVVGSLEETSTTTTKASPRSRRRGKKPVKEVLGAEPDVDQVSEE